jgi:uncharacterized protein with FMN-binding domain
MKIRPLWAILGLIVIAVAIVVLPILFKLKRYQSDSTRVGTVDVDISKVADGVYTGSYDSGPVIVVVDVTVKDRAITDIKLVKHRNGQGQAAAAITDKVIAAQSIKVDAVSGATMSSNVILLAIENALKGR